MTSQEIHDTLLSQFKRLHAQYFSWENKMSSEMKEKIFRSFLIDSVFGKVSPEIAVKALKMANSHEGLLSSLEIEEIYLESLKIIEIMKNSKDWTEFEELEKKPPPDKPKKELTDFDKILQGMLKVPKPDKDKKQKED
jgi:hypothetical protein